MPTPINIDEFLELVRKSAVVDEKRLTAYLDKLRATAALPAEPTQLARQMVQDGLLTYFQADQLLAGKWKRFTIGKYKVLERLGAGGMGSVYLCEHKLMRRRVAVKVLPTAKAEDPSSLERFYREARAVAALDHPNIVRAYDIDQDDKLHFLVMEHVDGASLQEIIKKTTFMDVLRAAHYMRQAALGLQHAHETAALVHRDIKPGNILVDRNGIVKVLDMGLARFFLDEEDVLTKKYDENVLGTADYLAPEQALDSHGVDIRADIYSLGATFYFCLTGKTPFAEGTVAQKLIWHQTRQPKPIRSLRPEVPEDLVAVIDKMMAKDPGQRYQTPQAVAEALAPFTQTPIPPPPENEMPQLSLAAMGTNPGDSASMAGTRPSGAEPSPTPRKVWQVNAPPSATQVPTAAGIQPSPTMRSPAGPPAPAVSPSNLGPASQARPAVAPVAKALSALPAAPSNGPLRQPTQTLPSFAVPKPTASSSALPAAPAAQAITTKPAAPAVDDEIPSWDQLTPETGSSAGRLDTNSGKRSSASLSRVRRGVKKPSPKRRTIIWVTVIVATVLVLAGLGVGIWLALNSPPPPPPPPVIQVKAPLLVHSNGDGGAYKTLQAAIDKAVSNDRIILKSHIRESVTVNRADLTGLSIEGEKDLNITWGPPPMFPAGMTLPKLLTLGGCAGCKVANIKFDGGGSGTEVLINIYGICPGLTLENLKLIDYKSAGVLVTNAEGSKEQPILFLGLELKNHPGSPLARAIGFEILPTIQKPAKNQYFKLSNLDFQGTGLRVVNQKGKPLEDIDLKGLDVEQK